jgi:hypothetical protein
MENTETTQTARIRVKLIPVINTLVIEKLSSKDKFFFTNDRSIAISVSSLSYLLLFLVQNGYVSPKVLEGILEEYYSNN